MDIHKLVDTVAQLDSKIKELDQIELSKKQVIENINNEIAKSCSNLEKKARELEIKVETKLNTLKNLDNELLKNKALLEKLISIQNYVDASASNFANNSSSNGNGNNNNGNGLTKQEDSATTEDTSKTVLQKTKSQSDFMNGSLEDFIVQQFEKEYQVKYPTDNNFRLTDKDFNKILSVLKEKAKTENNLAELINEYLSSYSQTLNDSQIKILEQERNNLQPS
jgi:hypothetical protein